MGIGGHSILHECMSRCREAMLICLEDAEGDVNTARAQQLPGWNAQAGTPSHHRWPVGLSSAQHTAWGAL